MKVLELKQLISRYKKQHGLIGYSKLNKLGLIEMLTSKFELKDNELVLKASSPRQEAQPQTGTIGAIKKIANKSRVPIDKATIEVTKMQQNQLNRKSNLELLEPLLIDFKNRKIDIRVDKYKNRLYDTYHKIANTLYENEADEKKAFGNYENNPIWQEVKNRGKLFLREYDESVDDMYLIRSVAEAFGVYDEQYNEYENYN
jgi:hypothetical protein